MQRRIAATWPPGGAVYVTAYVLQSSGLQNEPHRVELELQDEEMIEELCSCPAGTRSVRSTTEGHCLQVRAFVIIMAGLERLVAGWCSEQRVPCNTSEDNKCTLLVHRTDINKILLEAGLEIREDHRHAGGVRMAVTRIPVCNSPVWDKPGAWLKNASLKLVSSLIFQHSCFTTIEMYHNFPWSHEMRQGLSRQKALKSFTVHLVLRDGEDRDDRYDKFDILSYLPSPAVELVFELARSAFQVSGAPICGQIAEEILMHVTILRAENLRLNVRDAHAFLSALMDNDSVTDLGVHACVYAGDSRDPGGMFTSYLNERRGALRKITLTDSVSCGNKVLWMKMIPVLGEMTELEELYVNVSMDLKIYARMSGAFAGVAHQCKKLQRLRLPSPARIHQMPLPRLGDEEWMAPWLRALEETRTLRELRICHLGMTEAQCRSLFVAIAGKVTLHKVVLEDRANRLDLAKLSQQIQELGIGGRVRFRHLLIDSRNSSSLSKQPGLSSLAFDTLGVKARVWNDIKPTLECCEIFSRRGTMTTFDVHCDLFGHPAFGDLLSWLGECSTLTDVTIELFVHDDSYKCQRCADMCTALVSALALNSNIAGLNFVSLKLEAGHLLRLCESAHAYRSLTEINVIPACMEFEACRKEKQRRWDEGYHAAAVQLQEAVRQNASRISAAVRFILRQDMAADATVIALEELRNHPRLLEQVRDEANVTDAEAAAMVRDAASVMRR